LNRAAESRWTCYVNATPNQTHPAAPIAGTPAVCISLPVHQTFSHLAENHILKHVKHLPSLTHDIANTVNDAIIAATESGIQLPPPPGLLTAIQRKDVVRNIRVTVSDEMELANYYLQTTAKFCAPVASTLALHPGALHSRWSGLLVWAPSRNLEGYAMADGRLQFIPDEEGDDELRGLRAELVDAMDENTRTLYEALRKRFPTLATWELKSLWVGNHETVTAIAKLPMTGTFLWTSCTEPKCLRDPKHKTARERAS
jgi:hypothetical protein